VEACHQDDRCPGAADLDGRLGGDVLRIGLGKPFLFLGSQSGLTTTDGAVKPRFGPSSTECRPARATC
jgi:hypothetical protein